VAQAAGRVHDGARRAAHAPVRRLLFGTIDDCPV
jgi:hypothetical protein